VGIAYALFVVCTLLGWRTALLAVGVLVAGALIEIFITKPHWLGREVVQADLTALTFIVVGGIAPLRVPSTELYKAAAQVLPVLLLTYVIDKRLDFHGSDGPFERVSIFLVVAYMVSAGYITLDVLAYDEAQRGYANVIFASLAATVVSLTISLLTPPRDASKEAATAVASADADKRGRQPEADPADTRGGDTDRLGSVRATEDAGRNPGGSSGGADDQ